MTRSSWACAGALAALLALPATVQAMDDGPTDSPRTRRTSVVRVVNSGADATAAVVGGTQRREQVRLPEGDGLLPSMPTAEDTEPVTMDLSLEMGPMHEALFLHTLDAPLAAPRLTSEVQSIVRSELAHLHMLDLSVAP